MRITFVLPAPVRIPMGGAAVVYRHAAGLAARGHAVTVVAPREGAGGARAKARAVAVDVRDRLHRVGRAPYYDAPGVETREVGSLTGADVPSGDAVIATGYQTASWVAALNERAGEKAYFVQHDERHLTPAAEATWHLPLARIAVARWIADTLAAAGAPAEGVVPNAVDPADFAADMPLDGRPPRVVALYHRLPSKGPDTLIAALRAVRTARPDAEADVIAARPPSHAFPAWVRVHIRPDARALRALYNGAAVVLHTSRLEGWGLVPMEAAACGCAVVATASRGPAEYLRAGASMFEVPVGDAAALACETVLLLGDDAARVRLARAAMVDVGRFSWDASTAEFERLLVQLVRGGTRPRAEAGA
ncbi:MAG TPA: glycosyltransferase family 4 protein [Rubricoccaceae bacterium]